MNPSPLELFRRAHELGLRLEPAGDRLNVFGGYCPPDFAEELRQHKAELLAWLNGGSDYWRDRPTPELHLPDDFHRTFPATRRAPVRRNDTRTAWIHVARQVLAGEFIGADASTRQSLIIGLRGTEHPLCLEALSRLEDRRP